MKSAAKLQLTRSLLLIIMAGLTISACSGEPARDPYNDADSQRTRAKQAQDELSRETAK